MRYADPSASRDLLGNRTLLFIFICAFALVTLLQQILYGRNYIKRGLQFGWQSGDQLANWTGLFNVTDDPAVQSGSDSSSRVKQSELFDRWRSLQMCKWAMNISEANQFKSTLSRCCNAPSFLFTTQKNTPLGTKLKYEVDTSGIYHINQEIFRMFPKDMPYYRSQFKKCAVVGNGGILKNSRCGREINSADFVFRSVPRKWLKLSGPQSPHLQDGRKWRNRCADAEDSRAVQICWCNLPPISEKYTMDVGVKTDVVTVNPSIITERFHKLEKWRRPFYRVLQVYENASVLLPAFYNTRNTDVSIRVKYVLDDFESPQAVYYFHPQYLVNVSRYWLSLGVRAKRISTGLILATAALELCEEVHLFGFWAFPMNPSGLYITHHYYDNVKPRPGFHAMPSEIFNFLHLHSRGILRVHTGTCSCC
ncbi:alpha-2,8-sialyltransferase 8E isoform X2 [Camelus dromedarius]|uniref:Alpha-2,8-sialyltransferase 8E isoform X2 n=1 Tax=Camelus ferus TaxID=419612 RepID=A0A8B7K9A0_CAMFR|nr:alpha-2,8-sialyltransferase 8E isoform X2 [Camelus ferus]XP_031297838.1 alpha-2,8-sialyltransferase 8E isoform X2 [Camelus dromedarius]